MGIASIASITLSVDEFRHKGKHQLYSIVRFMIVARNGELITTDAIVLDSLPDRVSMPGRCDAIRQLKLEGYQLADSCEDFDTLDDISILIGANQFYNFIYGQSTSTSLYYMPSKLGTLLSGIIQQKPSISNLCTSAVDTVTVLRVATDSETDSIDDNLQRLWSLDSIGISYPCVVDDVTLRQFHDSIKYIGGHYEASLPWKSCHPLAKSRLLSSLKNLRKTPSLLKHYDDIIKSQVVSKFIEKVETPKTYVNKLHYLSHHSVRKDFNYSYSNSLRLFSTL